MHMAQQDKKQYRTNPWTFSATVGLFAGLIWGSLNMLFQYLDFTNVEPAFFMKTWYVEDYFHSRGGQIVGLFWFVVLSIAASLLYAAVLRKVRGPWMGIAYGLLWWALLYALVGPLIGSSESIFTLDKNSFWTSLSLYILWGVFIGYSISFEFTDEQKRANMNHILR